MDVVCAAAFRINVNSQVSSKTVYKIKEVFKRFCLKFQEGEESKEIKLAKKLFDNNAFLKNPFFWLMCKLLPSVILL